MNAIHFSLIFIKYCKKKYCFKKNTVLEKPFFGPIKKICAKGSKYV